MILLLMMAAPLALLGLLLALARVEVWMDRPPAERPVRHAVGHAGAWLSPVRGEAVPGGTADGEVGQAARTPRGG